MTENAVFGIVPKRIPPISPSWLDEFGLDVYQFRVYLAIWRRAGQESICWEKLEPMAERLKISKRKLISVLSELEELGLARKVRKQRRVLIEPLIPEVQEVHFSNPEVQEVHPRSAGGALLSIYKGSQEGIPSKKAREEDFIQNARQIVEDFKAQRKEPEKQEGKKDTAYQSVERFNPTAKMESRFRQGQIFLECPWESNALHEEFLDWLQKELNCGKANAGSFLISARRNEEKNEKAHVYWTEFQRSKTNSPHGQIQSCPHCQDGLLRLPKLGTLRCRCEAGDRLNPLTPQIGQKDYAALQEFGNE